MLLLAPARVHRGQGLDFSSGTSRDQLGTSRDQLGILDRLELNEAEVERVTKPHLTKSEVKAVMVRRDKIVAHFQKLIAEKGENEVIY